MFFFSFLVDDCRTSPRHESKPPTLLRGSGWGGDRDCLGRLGAWACMEETSVWFVFLQCSCPREKEVWSSRMEYPVRVHGLGSRGICRSFLKGLFTALIPNIASQIAQLKHMVLLITVKWLGQSLNSDKYTCSFMLADCRCHRHFKLRVAQPSFPILPPFKVHLTPKIIFGRDEALQHSHEEFDNIIRMWYF